MTKCAGPARHRLRAAIVAALSLSALSAVPDLGSAFDRLGAERELVALTNAARTSNELVSLRPHDGLIDVARSRSEDMAERDYFSHEIPPENYYFERLLDEQGIAYRRAGENIARNNRTDEESARRAQAGFLNSPPHRANILDPLFREIGAGAWDRPDGMKYFTVLFLLPPGAARREPAGGQWLAAATAAPGERDVAQVAGTALASVVGLSRTAHAQSADQAEEVAGAARRVEAERARPDSSPAVAATPPAPGAVTAAPPAPLGLLDSIITRVLKLYLSL
ncbi:MAG: hypothetical protein IRZ14_10060 [Chloroflexi bacterium]|nr:hypothetical protein [Chloroflexota bacterium]